MPYTADKLNISFYAARFEPSYYPPLYLFNRHIIFSYHDEYHSAFPMGDITALIPDALADVCVLEEPEHLTWYINYVQSIEFFLNL